MKPDPSAIRLPPPPLRALGERTRGAELVIVLSLLPLLSKNRRMKSSNGEPRNCSGIPRNRLLPWSGVS